jgi:hypothetical protein
VTDDWEALCDEVQVLRRAMRKIKDQVDIVKIGMWRMEQSSGVRQAIQRFAPRAEMLEEHFDLCVSGVTRLPDGQGGMNAHVVYDIDKMVQMYIERGLFYEQGMDAVTQLQASVSHDHGPVFVLELPVR